MHTTATNDHNNNIITTGSSTPPPSVTALFARVEQIAVKAAQGARTCDRTGAVARDVFDQLRASGVTAAMVPAELGGAGATHTEMGQMIRRLAAADPAVGVTLSMHAHLLGAQVWRHHHGLDASAVFEKVRAGAFLVSTGASDWLGSEGSARRVDGGYVVSGRKAPVSGCELGDVLVTSIRWDDAPERPQVVHCSIPLSASGVSIEATWDTVGLRATGSHTVLIDEVFVPDTAVSLLRPADVWHPIWNVVLGTAMPLIMAAYAGIADAAVSAALEAVRDVDDAQMSTLIGEMTNAHILGCDSVDAMFQSSDNLRFDNNDEHTSRTLSRKTNASEALITAVRLAAEVAGGRAFSRTSDLERLLRDIHGCLFHPLPKAKQVVLTGRVARGLGPVA